MRTSTTYGSTYSLCNIAQQNTFFGWEEQVHYDYAILMQWMAKESTQNFTFNYSY